MSYCRFSDADVYAYSCGGGYYQIHTVDHRQFTIKGLSEFRAKLAELAGQGLDIPDRVFERIQRELSN